MTYFVRTLAGAPDVSIFGPQWQSSIRPIASAPREHGRLSMLQVADPAHSRKYRCLRWAGAVSLTVRSPSLEVVISLPMEGHLVRQGSKRELALGCHPLLLRRQLCASGSEAGVAALRKREMASRFWVSDAIRSLSLSSSRPRFSASAASTCGLRSGPDPSKQGRTIRITQVDKPAARRPRTCSTRSTAPSGYDRYPLASRFGCSRFCSS